MPLMYGKKPPQFHPKTLLISNYLTTDALPPPEAKRGWEYAVSDYTWSQSMLGNDQVGDCVIAAMLHYRMAASAAAGNGVPPFSTEDALNIYSSITGYNPADPSTDQGTAWTSALAYWQETGILGHKILGWGAFDYTNPVKLNQAIDIFGGVLVGTIVTESMEQQFGMKQEWTAPFSGGEVGAHGIPILGFGRKGRTCITWAARQAMDLTMPTALWDEAYIVIDDEWLKNAKATPILGLNLDALEADLKLIAG